MLRRSIRECESPNLQIRWPYRHRWPPPLTRTAHPPRIRSGEALVHLTDQLAISDDGRRCALAAAGAAPVIDLDTSEEERSARSTRTESAIESEEEEAGGSPALPQELGAPQARLARRRARETEKRRRRRQMGGGETARCPGPIT